MNSFAHILRLNCSFIRFKISFFHRLNVTPKYSKKFLLRKLPKKRRSRIINQTYFRRWSSRRNDWITSVCWSLLWLSCSSELWRLLIWTSNWDRALLSISRADKVSLANWEAVSSIGGCCCTAADRQWALILFTSLVKSSIAFSRPVSRFQSDLPPPETNPHDVKQATHAKNIDNSIPMHVWTLTEFTVCFLREFFKRFFSLRLLLLATLFPPPLNVPSVVPLLFYSNNPSSYPTHTHTHLPSFYS